MPVRAWPQELANILALPGATHKYPLGPKFKAFGYTGLTLMDVAALVFLCLVVYVFCVSWIQKRTRKLQRKTARLEAIKQAPPEDE